MKDIQNVPKYVYIHECKFVFRRLQKSPTHLVYHEFCFNQHSIFEVM